MRVLWGWILFLIAVASIIIGGLFFPVVMCIAAYIGGEEFIAMTRAKGMNPSPRIMRSMIIAFFVMAAMPAVPGLHLPWNFSLTHFPILLTIGVCASFFRL